MSSKSSVLVVKESFELGNVVPFKVKLDPSTINFIPGIYNVDSVMIYRKITHPGGSTSVEKVHSVSAVDGQTKFNEASCVAVFGELDASASSETSEPSGVNVTVTVS